MGYGLGMGRGRPPVAYPIPVERTIDKHKNIFQERLLFKD